MPPKKPPKFLFSSSSSQPPPSLPPPPPPPPQPSQTMPRKQTKKHRKQSSESRSSSRSRSSSLKSRKPRKLSPKPKRNFTESLKSSSSSDEENPTFLSRLRKAHLPATQKTQPVSSVSLSLSSFKLPPRQTRFSVDLDSSDESETSLEDSVQPPPPPSIRPPPTPQQQMAARKLQRVFVKDKTVRNIRISYLKAICGDVGICISLNYNFDKIMEMFNYFRDFRDLVNSPSVIGQPSANGIVRLLKYTKIEGELTFHSYGVIKTAVTAQSDNLFYEYLVGKYCVNFLCQYFPIFVPTYGIYLNNTGIAFNDPAPVDRAEIQNGLVPLEFPADIRAFCRQSDRLCLVGQFYNNFKVLKSYSEDVRHHRIENEIPFFLFQIYFALAECQAEFTHYDLHYKNVGLVALPVNTHIDYEYLVSYPGNPQTTVRFKSRYLVKVIDYGRSFFSYQRRSSPNLIDYIDQSGECPDELQSFGLYEKPEHFINPRLNNQSHDLRLLHILKQKHWLFVKYPTLGRIVRSVQYMNSFGTPYRQSMGLDMDVDAPIFAVDEAAVKLASYLNENIDNVMVDNTAMYMGSKSLGTLKVYESLNQQMSFTPSVRNKAEVVGTQSRYQNPDIPNADISGGKKRARR
jgi:hypothetical protein